MTPVRDEEILTDRTDVPNWVRLRVMTSGRVLLGDGDDPVHMATVELDLEAPRFKAIEWTPDALDEHIDESTRQQWLIFVSADIAEERRRRREAAES
jgi:hypothetical protein